MENAPYRVLRRHLYELSESLAWLLAAKAQAIRPSTYIRDSNHLLDLLNELGELSPNSKVFVADANSM